MGNAGIGTAASRAGGGSGVSLGPVQNTFGDTSSANQAAAETLRDDYATANADWLALYDGDRAFLIRLVWSGNAQAFQRRNVAGNGWETVTRVAPGTPGTPGTDGAPGGGAIESTGIVLDLRTTNIADDEFRSTGLMLGARGTTPQLLYRVEANTLALLWFSTDQLYDLATAAAGTDIDTTGTDRNALSLPESSGSSVSGNVMAGITAANELLIAFTEDDPDTYVEFFRYVPSEAQGGLTADERAKFDGIEDGATADQTGAEIKSAYEGEGDTNAFTDARLAKLAGIESAATQDQTGAEIKSAYEGEADTNALTDALATKLNGIAAGANLLLPYKLGNVYRAVAASDPPPTKPADNAGTATTSGITVAPTGWQLTRPEATAALPYVYDCHVYGYQTNATFGWQFGTANRTDRYIDAPTIAEVLTQIMAGTGINVNRSVAGQITITATGGGGGGGDDGVVSAATFDEATQVLTLTTTLGGTVTVNLGAFITADELTMALASYILADGTRAFTAPVAGVTPTDDAHLATKAYVDGAAGTEVAANPTGTDGDDLDRLAIAGTNFNVRGEGSRFFYVNRSNVNITGNGVIELTIPGIDDSETGDAIAFQLPAATASSSIFATMQVNSGAIGNVEYSNFEGVHLDHMVSTDNDITWIVWRYGGAYILLITDPMRQVSMTVNELGEFARFVTSENGADNADYIKIRARDLYEQIRPTGQHNGVDVVTSPIAYDFRGAGVAVEGVAGVLQVTIAGGSTPTPVAHTRFAVLRTADDQFGLADLSGTEVTTSETDELTLPTWASGTRFFAIYQEATADEYTDIREQGSPFNRRDAFTIASATVMFMGEELRIYVYDDQLLQIASGEVWECSS